MFEVIPNFHFKKKWGQNFLNNDQILERISNLIQCENTSLIVEIGAGSGNLTAKIASKNKTTIALEIDKLLVSHLQKKFANSQKVFPVQGDILNPLIQQEIIKKSSGEELTIIGNLPYYIASKIIWICLQKFPFKQMILMLPIDLCKRLTASPGTKQYGKLTAFCNYFAHLQFLFEVKRENFTPVPQIHSGIVLFESLQHHPLVTKNDYADLLKKSFLMKRKKLTNNLKKHYSTKTIENSFKELSYDSNLRAEDLSPNDYQKLWIKLEEKAKCNV